MSSEDKLSILEAIPFKVEKLPVRPKCQGGLGLKDLNIWNKAMLTKHLWQVAMEKESVWVKWISVEKLKGRSVWVINEEANDSWGWKNILKLRDEVRGHIVMKIGNGEKAKVVYDNWSSVGILQYFITQRDIYDVRLNANMQSHILLDIHKKDELIWKSREGKECLTENIHYGWKWKNLVWFTQNIPKHAFILWMAILNKLSTQDKVRMWGSTDVMRCPLCCNDMDSHDHLFFKCQFANEFWRIVKAKIEVTIADMGWNEIVVRFSQMYTGNSIGSIIRRIGLAASVYLIWKERNCRIFKDEKKSISELAGELFEIMRLRLLSLKTKKSQATFNGVASNILEFSGYDCTCLVVFSVFLGLGRKLD
ncbi:RNA-directed DNA polymerase, eukaryota, reverse transcriptase zinc-binding domain protein [Tanacetum coccineum]